MKTIKLVILASFAALFFSCDDFLDVRMEFNTTEEMFFGQGVNNFRALGMGSYSYLRGFNDYGGGMLATACDEADYAKPANIQRFNTGAWGPFTNPNDVFGHYYAGIRHVNLFLEKSKGFETKILMDTVTQKPTWIKDCDDIYRLQAEARFLRAYYFMELIKRYGGLPIVTTVLTEDEAKNVTRSSFQECAQWVADECDAVYPELADTWLNYGIPTGQTRGRGEAPGITDVTRLGRIEKVAAKALKIRALLYAASPLHNESSDPVIWEKVAKAGNDFFTDANCIWAKTLNTNYKALFDGSVANNLTPRKGANSGIIMTRYFSNTGSDWEKLNYPVGLINGGGGCTCPTQDLVDAFETKTQGLPINDPNAQYNPVLPYMNRDPRFDAMIAYNGSKMGKEITGVDHIIQAYETPSGAMGVDAIGSKYGATTTGYYLRKFSIDNYDLTKTNNKAKTWILMRYAEVLLNYAEAMNEIYGPDAKGTYTYTAREAVNLVRARAAMPAFPAGMTKEAFRTKYRNERRIELAFEEQRFFDVRRWKIAEITENKPIRGVKIMLDNNVPTYNYFDVETRVFNAPQMYLYPIPQAEVLKTPGLTQNTGW